MKKLFICTAIYAVALVTFGQTNVTSVPLPPASGVWEQLVGFINSLYGLPGHIIVALSCVAVGYALRFVKQFPNDGIPLASILWGMVFNPLMADTRAPEASLRLWLVKNVLLGLIIGVLSWIFHKSFLKRFEEGIPVIGDMLANADHQSATAAAQRLVAKAAETGVQVEVKMTGTV